jgi:hypothetical protein
VGYTIKEWIITKHIPWKKILFWTIAGLCALAIYIPLWDRIFPEAVGLAQTTYAGGGFGGDFSGKLEYIKSQWLRVLLSIGGLWFMIKQKKFSHWAIGYFIGILWIGI